MSIGIDENNQVHELGSNFNPKIVDVIAAMKLLRDTRACIDYLGNGKSLEELRKGIEAERINERAGELRKEIGVER